MSEPIARLRNIMQRLRDPDGGCPWDVEQTHASIANYTLEEAYEVVDAIERNDISAMKEELGDLLLQVIFHSQMAKEKGFFDFNDVATGISDKMVARHPHVFGNVEIADAAAQSDAWEAMKAKEREAKRSGPASLLDDIPAVFPATTRAAKLQKRAARVGFDWGDLGPVFAKIEEELAECRATLDGERPGPETEDEIGDLLFACVNLARKLGIDPETALRSTNRKFERRFRHIEQTFGDAGRDIAKASLEEMETLWVEAKRKEKR